MLHNLEVHSLGREGLTWRRSMDQLIRFIQSQEAGDEGPVFSQLSQSQSIQDPHPWNTVIHMKGGFSFLETPSRTHPQQTRQDACFCGCSISSQVVGED